MGVYIKGMEMPKACVYRENGQLITCPLYDIDGYCGALNTEASHKENGKLSDCPLIPVPPHGRLIDADALIAKLNMMIAMAFGEGNTAFHFAYRSLGKVVENAPTVIEAEEVEE